MIRKRKFLPHGIPEWVQSGAVYFLTICCKVRGNNALCSAESANVIFEATGFRHKANKWYVHLLLLMPDHLHALVSFPRVESMRKVVYGFKEMTAKRSSVTWQRDFFEHRLRSDESFDEKAHYIRMNPVRKGLAEAPEKWPWVWRADNKPGGPSGPALPVVVNS
ncbi:MAG: transposase [Opitutaceae bacterium]|nr:transposase [Opitutaceae bacterium]